MPPLIARAPVRLDFGGGWTDVPPYSEERGGFVCNLAIARYAVVRLALSSEASRPESHDASAPDAALIAAALSRSNVRGVDVTLTSDFPVGAGLGGSSAAGVALVGALAAWKESPLAPSELAEASRAMEVEDLGIAGGRQDHYAAAHGGALALTFGASTDVRRLRLTPDCCLALERRCIVAYTGRSRISDKTIRGVLDAYRARDPIVLQALDEMATLARGMAAAIENEAVDELALMVDAQWQHQRALHAAITTPEIESVMRSARTAGCMGAKALGASGGGCVLMIAEDGREGDVRDAVSRHAALLPFQIDHDGFSVVQPGGVG